MSPAQLKSITLTNFRSIRGSITVPLDVPIVLVHGQNGAGKTSLLSGDLPLKFQLAAIRASGVFDTRWEQPAETRSVHIA